MSLLLRTKNLTKSYSGTTVLNKVNVDLHGGEVHIFFGENGAGKSTLISLLAGANTPTSGDIFFKEKLVRLDSVLDARNLGISAVFQEFSLIPQMTVAENIFLGSEMTSRGFLSKRKLLDKAEEILETLDFDLSPQKKVHQLTRAEQQMVEIAKAFRSDLSVLILDEPTASLTHHETEQLFRLVNKVKSQGVGIIYITHRMDEIKQIGSRITVLRDGNYIDTLKVKDATEDKLVELMTGRSFDKIFPEIKFSPADVVLEVNKLSTEKNTIKDVDFHIRRGEIVGLTGLVGSGKSEFVQACFGVDKVSKGTVSLNGEDVTNTRMAGMLKRGFLYLPSDRRREGLIMMRSARENISISALKNKIFSRGVFLNKKNEIIQASKLSDKLSLSPNRIEQAVELFSGGNQQKVMLARSLNQDFDVIVFDEPTVGVDVGARVIIYKFIADLCKSGVAVILVSSDMPEIIHLSNRAYVFHRGLVQKELKAREITESNILSYFFDKSGSVA